MANTQELVDRGLRGHGPRPATHDDEAALDFLTEVKNILFYAQFPWVLPEAAKVLKKKGIAMEHSLDGVKAIREAIQDFRPGASWLRVMRTSQDMVWDRATETVDRQRELHLKELEESDKSGPGSVSWDPNFDMPKYATVEVHTQPGGYVGDPLAGLVFEHGTRVFYGGAVDDDGLHKTIASKVSEPLDGKVNRVMDIACSIGQLTCALKERFPDAEVRGSDISAPMVRYAHKRAIGQNLDVHFSQLAAESLSFPDNHFDLVTAYILFHEIPLQVTDQVIKEVFRVLRPGGTFVVFDFPSEEGDLDRLDYSGFLGSMDSSDNSEPYAPAFIRCGFEKKLEDAGFSLRYTDAEEMGKHGRVCDKPA